MIISLAADRGSPIPGYYPIDLPLSPDRVYSIMHASLSPKFRFLVGFNSPCYESPNSSPFER